MTIFYFVYKKKKIIYYFLSYFFKCSLYIIKNVFYNNNYLKKMF